MFSLIVKEKEWIEISNRFEIFKQIEKEESFLLLQFFSFIVKLSYPLSRRN